MVAQHGPGVDGFIQDAVNRLFRQGYIAAAPELFHRQPAQIPEGASRVGLLKLQRRGARLPELPRRGALPQPPRARLVERDAGVLRPIFANRYLITSSHAVDGKPIQFPRTSIGFANIIYKILFKDYQAFRGRRIILRRR